MSWPVAGLNPLSVPLLGPPTIEKVGMGAGREACTTATRATAPPPCGRGRRDARADRVRRREREGRADLAVVLGAPRPSAVWPSDAERHAGPEEAEAGLSAPVSLCCWVQIAPDRVNRNAAPTMLESIRRAPISGGASRRRRARRSIAERRAFGPRRWWDELGPCWLQVAPEPVNTQAAPPIDCCLRSPPMSAVLPSADDGDRSRRNAAAAVALDLAVRSSLPEWSQLRAAPARVCIPRPTPSLRRRRGRR